MTERAPKYRLHRRSGQACVRLNGTDIYRGKHGTKPSREKYHRLIGKWIANGRTLPKGPEDLSVAELVLQFLRFADGYYSSSERENQIVSEHIDDGSSGGAPLDRRPALLAALTAFKRDGAAAVVVAKRDRLARDVVTAALAERMAQRAGGEILSADGVGNGSAPENALMRTIVDGFAQYERALIAARTRAALDAKWNRGERVSRYPPFGSRWQDDLRVPVEHELALLQRMLEMQDRGLGALRIANRLNEQGDGNPRTCRPWNRGSIASILRTAARRAAS